MLPGAHDRCFCHTPGREQKEKKVVMRSLLLGLWLLSLGAEWARAADEPDAPLSLAAALPAQPPAFAIDLDTALRLAQDENPDIAIARVAIMEARARATLANLLLVPNLNAGGNYHGHVGDLQRSSGRIISLSEQSLYFGGGARTLAAESIGVPMITFSAR
jgi:outer membrane protein TolC